MMARQHSPLLLTMAEAARRLGVHLSTLRRMIRRGDVSAVRFGRSVRVYAPTLATAAPKRRHRKHRST